MPSPTTTLASAPGCAWSPVYRAASSTRSALWIVPFVAILVVIVVVPLIQVGDSTLDWNFFWSEHARDGNAVRP